MTDTTVESVATLSTEDVGVFRRFWSKALIGDGCWEWQGALSDGYGRFQSGVVKRAHRIAYEWLVGPIPEGLTIDHLCRNRACVRPDHLEAVTNKVNLLRGMGVAAVAAASTHCPKNHPYDGANTYARPDGGRDCRTCHRDRQRARYRR